MPNPIFSIKKATLLGSENKKILFINNFQIHRGTVYAIDGSSASGKTIFMDMLSGNSKISSGVVNYEDESISSLSGKTKKQEIHYVRQITKVPWWGNVNDYIRKKISKYNHITNIDKKIGEITRKLKLSNLLEKNIKDLTPSQFRSILLAIGIIADTKVLIIDELEQHLSKKYLNQLSKILYRKANYDGVTIIFTTQNKEMFPSGLTSITITLDSGRISSVRSKGGNKGKTNNRTKKN